MDQIRNQTERWSGPTWSEDIPLEEAIFYGALGGVLIGLALGGYILWCMILYADYGPLGLGIFLLALTIAMIVMVGAMWRWLFRAWV
jgi:hypothetical protein